MRNGTQSKLTLVDNAGNELSALEVVEDLSVAYDNQGADDAKPAPQPFWTNKTIFAALSIACATAAIAAGTYAFWLSKQKATDAVLTDVRDILENANRRMSQMEADLREYPSSNGNVA